MEFFVVGGAIVFAGWMLFGTRHGIDYKLQETDARNVNGEAGDLDFANYGELKSAVAKTMKGFACPSCGCRRVSGSGVIVRYGKVHLYRTKAKTGWFGGTTSSDVFAKTVWRIHEVGLTPGDEGGLLSEGTDPGMLECRSKGCSWKEEAPVLPRPSFFESMNVRFVSINDLLRGKIQNS